ncbi:MAG: protein TolA, partial [Mailhella sp.]|nr:protein TolA [Mailhella sp.]
MRSTSLILSLMLHFAVLAFILYVPLRPPVDLTRPVYQVSLVMGAPGGEKLPSPVLGARPPVTGKQVTSTESAPPKTAEPAPAPAQTQPEAPSIPAPETLKTPEPEQQPKQPEP